MALTVRADTFEVSSVTPLIGIAFGMDYSFLARETTIEVSQSPSFVHKQDWIVVKGQQGGRRTELAVASERPVGIEYAHAYCRGPYAGLPIRQAQSLHAPEPV